MTSKKTSSKQSALSKVQSLYVMQVELWNFLDEKEIDKERAKKTLKQFNDLLKEVDWQYMGGEEVMQTLQAIPQEVNKKLKLKGGRTSAPAKKPAAKKPVATARTKAKKPTAKKATKKTTKKK